MQNNRCISVMGPPPQRIGAVLEISNQIIHLKYNFTRLGAEPAPEEEVLCDTRCHLLLWVPFIPLGTESGAFLSGKCLYTLTQRVIWGTHHSAPPCLGQSVFDVRVWEFLEAELRDETPFLPDSQGGDVSLKIGSNHGHCLQERVGLSVWGSEAERSGDLLFVCVSKLLFSLREKPEKWCKKEAKQKMIFNGLERGFSVHLQMRKKEAPNEFWGLNFV